MKLKYKEKLIHSTKTRLIESQMQQQDYNVQAIAPIQIILPFKDKKSADVERRQLSNLGKKIDSDLCPVFTSKKIANKIKVAEAKPLLINQQCIFYKFKCDLCDADYVGYTPDSFMSISTQLSENTCVTPTIRITILKNNSPS